MIVDLKTISDIPRRFDLLLAPDWWVAEEEGGQVLGLDGPLEVHIVLYRAGSRYVLEGRLSGGFCGICDRCLDPYKSPLAAEFRVFLTLPPGETEESEIELTQNDMFIDFIMAEEIELDDIVREQLYLALPMKFLCREDCAGLCPSCGANLNRQKCACKVEAGHPGFSKLKNLKL